MINKIVNVWLYVITKPIFNLLGINFISNIINMTIKPIQKKLMFFSHLISFRRYHIVIMWVPGN